MCVSGLDDATRQLLRGHHFCVVKESSIFDLRITVDDVVVVVVVVVVVETWRQGTLENGFHIMS